MIPLIEIELTEFLVILQNEASLFSDNLPTEVVWYNEYIYRSAVFPERSSTY